MEAYKIEILLIDFDEVGDEIKDIIENTKYPNRCIDPHVLSVSKASIGEWDDGHPLNQSDGYEEYLSKVFPNARLALADKLAEAVASHDKALDDLSEAMESGPDYHDLIEQVERTWDSMMQALAAYREASK